MMWAVVMLATVASMVIAVRMARARGRSAKIWLWVSAFVGPLGPFALYILGDLDEKVG